MIKNKKNIINNKIVFGLIIFIEVIMISIMCVFIYKNKEIIQYGEEDKEEYKKMLTIYNQREKYGIKNETKILKGNTYKYDYKK